MANPTVSSTGEVMESIKPQSEQTLNEIRRWLLATDFKGKDSQLSKHLDVHMAGTSEWLLESDKYQQWKSSDSQGFLLLCGECLLSSLIMRVYIFISYIL